MKIPVLSIRQPFADWILTGAKWCENRTWTTRHRGELWIHASTTEPGALDYFGDPDPAWPAESPLGFRERAIIGAVDLVGVVTVERLDELHYADACDLEGEELAVKAVLERVENDSTWEHTSGPYCWIVANPRPLAEPIEVSGRLRIWKYAVKRSRLALAEPAEIRC